VPRTRTMSEFCAEATEANSKAAIALAPIYMCFIWLSRLECFIK
jgi:hypothetical protein